VTPHPMTFQLDTSGAVRIPPSVAGLDGTAAYETRTYGKAREVRWSDLTPFQQGYIEALLCPWPVDTDEEREASAGAGPGFSDLAPATLGRILEDCKARRASSDCVENTVAGGRSFWTRRQAGDRKPAFPPLVVSLSDDGLVYLNPGEQQ
jgi:hypothetical protein